MPKTKTTKRTIYSYKLRLNQTVKGTSSEIRMDAAALKRVFDFIIGLPQEERVIEQANEWFFFLDSITYDLQGGDGHTPNIRGLFKWVRLSARTALRRRRDMATRTNPKEPDESEERHTHFYIRSTDGLLLLDSQLGNVVTGQRFNNYISLMGAPIFEESFKYTTLEKVIEKSFLDALGKFKVIKLARIRLAVDANANYSEGDGISLIQADSQAVKGDYAEIVLGKRYARGSGLSATELVSRVTRYLSKERILSGTIEGWRSDGTEDQLKIQGIHERGKVTVETNIEGEALLEQVFASMIKIGKEHAIVH